MDIDKLIQIVETEVKKALTDQVGSTAKTDSEKALPSGKKVLALFTGGYAKLSEALAQIEKLIQGYCSVDVVMSQSAVNVIGQDKIRAISGITSLICEPDVSISSLKLVQKSDVIIVPVLTRNTATKVALGITDTLVTNIIMQALISAKPIIAARNSADPSDADCPCVAMPNTPPVLIKLAENYLQKLESYGMKLVDVTEIAQIVLSDVNKGDSLDHKLITQETIDKLPKSTKRVTVAKGSIITPLARDVAKERGIEIVFASE
jgi:hypothetical protein